MFYILAEYQDLWTVQRKWNSKHELKAQFEKRPGIIYMKTIITTNK